MIVVRCFDGHIRHGGPFETQLGAVAWAEWGHFCEARHTFQVVEVQSSPHHCGGTLWFIPAESAEHPSYEYCTNCGWRCNLTPGPNAWLGLAGGPS